MELCKKISAIEKNKGQSIFIVFLLDQKNKFWESFQLSLYSIILYLIINLLSYQSIWIIVA
jgi:hypothetical protein